MQADLCVPLAGTAEMVLWCCPAENRLRTAADPAGPAEGAAETVCAVGVERIFLLGEYGIASERKFWDNGSYGVPLSGGICTLPYDRVPSKSPPFCITLPSLSSVPSHWGKIICQTKTFLAFRTSISESAAEASAITYQKGPYKKGQTLGVRTAAGSGAFPAGPLRPEKNTFGGLRRTKPAV